MEDTGQDTTIRIGVDGTGVGAGLTSVKRSIADLEFRCTNCSKIQLFELK